MSREIKIPITTVWVFSTAATSRTLLGKLLCNSTEGHGTGRRGHLLTPWREGAGVGQEAGQEQRPLLGKWLHAVLRSRHWGGPSRLPRRHRNHLVASLPTVTHGHTYSLGVPHGNQATTKSGHGSHRKLALSKPLLLQRVRHAVMSPELTPHQPMAAEHT